MAQNTLEIIIKASAGKAIAELNKLDKSIDKFGSSSIKGFDKLKKSFSDLDAKLASPAGIKSLIGTAGMVAGALAGVGMAVKKLADDYMNYAFQVKDFGRIIGATPEEASKLIQVADDVRLSVESMTTAMKAAITKGYAPTIEELGRMSDAYLAISDPIARSSFLIETFGRSGLEMAKLMELGSKAIEEMGTSVEGTARLMTSEGIKAAEEYYAALDQLGEVGEDLSLTFGSKFVPVLADLASGFSDVSSAALSSDNVLTNVTKSLFAQATSVEEVAMLLGLYVTNTITGAEVTQYLNEKLKALDNILKDIPPDMNELVREEEIATDATGDLGKEAQNARGDFKALSGQMVMTAAEIAAAAQKLSTIKLQAQYFDIKARFSLPDLTSELANIVKSDKWRKAGGEVLIDIVPKLNIMGLTDEARAAAAKELAALELAIKVSIGEIDAKTAQEELQKAFGATATEAKATIQAALEVDPTSEQGIKDYLSGRLFNAKVYPELQELDKTTIENALKLVPMTVEPKADDKAVEDVKKQLGEATMTVTPKMDSVGLRTVLNQIPSSKTLTVRVRVTGLEALNNIPGGGGGGDGSTPEKPGPRPSGGKAATGLNMIVPPGYLNDTYPIYATSGERVRIETPAQQKQSNSVTNITNNFVIGSAQAMDMRELARQISREQQRAGRK